MVTEAAARPRAADGPPAPHHEARRAELLRRVGWLVAASVALAPAARMAWVVVHGSPLQFSDYWMMVGEFTTPDGGLDLGGLFTFRNHPVVLPQVVYWINIQLFAGSNITLGLFVVGLVVAQLAIVVLLLRSADLRPIDRMVGLALAGVLLFNLTGTWNFTKSMSGTAWLSANLFTLAALHLRARDRRWPALGLAALASISYGTGLVAWPAVAVAGIVRTPPRAWWREWPAAAGLLATVVWYRTQASQGNDVELPGPGRTFAVASDLVGFVVGLEGRTAELVGGAVLVVAPLVALLAWRVVGRSAAGWIGVTAFGWAATMLISVVRYQLLELFNNQSRYSSLPSLVWLGLVVLLVQLARAAGARRVLQARWVAPVVALPLIVVGLLAGDAELQKARNERHAQAIREVALHLDVVDGTGFLFGGFGDPVTVTDRLRAMDHHPFVDDWALDCGLLGTRLTDVGPAPVPDSNVGELVLRRPNPALGTVTVTGVLTDDRPVRCVVVADRDGRVVGAGPHGIDLSSFGASSEDGFQAIAARGPGPLRAYAFFHGDRRPHRVIGRITREDFIPE